MVEVEERLDLNINMMEAYLHLLEIMDLVELMEAMEDTIYLLQRMG